jgi:hypothetical protein
MLFNLREADEFGTDTEAGTLSGGEADSGGEEIKYSEDGGSEESKSADFTHVELLLGDDDSSNSYSETFYEILNDTSYDVRNHAVHFIYDT